MPLQNRVMPTGEIIAHPARGQFMGNRGHIHRADRTLGASRWKLHAWLICVTCYPGRQRQVWDDSYTELFFLDEAVALAAGHRPCFECRRAAFHRFQSAWRAAHGEPATAPAMNARMHADRIATGRAQRRHPARLGDLPHGSFVLHGDAAALLADGRLYPYDPGGYRPPHAADPNAQVTVLTPRCTVAVLHAGYRPVLAPLPG